MFFHYERGTDPSAEPASLARTFLMIDKSWEGSACMHGCSLHAFGSACHVVSLYCDSIKLGSRFQGLFVVVKEERVRGWHGKIYKSQLTNGVRKNEQLESGIDSAGG